MRLKKCIVLLVTLLMAVSCDKDEYFDEFEVDIDISGDISKFEGNLHVLSYHQDGSTYLVSSADGNNVVSDGQGNFYITDVGFNNFYTSVDMKSINVGHNFSVTSETLEDENWRDYSMTVTLTIRRNGSQIDNNIMVYGGESSPTGFFETYTIN